MKVKICGITNLEDAKTAVEYGADALGFIFCKRSPRFIPKEEIRKIIFSLPPFITTVGVFTEGTEKEMEEAITLCGIDFIQFHGPFPKEVLERFSERAIPVVSVRTTDKEWPKRPCAARAYLLERAPKGDPTPFTWEKMLPTKAWGKILVAGGLHPENVREAIDKVAPYAVDACSGIEREPGKKDPVLLKRFIAAAKG